MKSIIAPTHDLACSSSVSALHFEQDHFDSGPQPRAESCFYDRIYYIQQPFSHLLPIDRPSINDPCSPCQDCVTLYGVRVAIEQSEFSTGNLNMKQTTCSRCTASRLGLAARSYDGSSSSLSSILVHSMVTADRHALRSYISSSLIAKVNSTSSHYNISEIFFCNFPPHPLQFPFDSQSTSGLSSSISLELVNRHPLRQVLITFALTSSDI
jgi:hypothetical protein